MLAPSPSGRIVAPEGIARDASGNVYVTQIRQAGIVYRARKGSEPFVLVPWAVVEPDRNPGLLGVVVDDTRGFLYVCATNVHRGAVYAIPLAHPDRPQLLAHGLGFPNALTLRGADLLVSDCGVPQGFANGRILRIAPDKALNSPDASSESLVKLTFPNGLAVRDDVLYVAQTNLGLRNHGAVAAYRFTRSGLLEQKPFARQDLRGWPDGVLLHGEYLYVALQKERTICRLRARDLTERAEPKSPLMGKDGRCAPASLILGNGGDSLHFTDVQEPSPFRILLGSFWTALAPRAHQYVYEIPLQSFVPLP